VAGNKALGTCFVLALLLPTPTLWGQQGAESTKGATAATAPPSRGPASGDRPALQRRNARYRIQPDDSVSISFPLSQEFNQSVTVQPDGYINLQGIGGLYVAGMTVPDLVSALKREYSRILHDPIVDVDLVDFQKPFFIVAGQVTKPGQYDLRYDTTVSEAIAIAGGFTPEAKTQVLLYHRVSDDWVEVKKLNLKDILHGKHVNEDAGMQSGDMIFVPEKFITSFRKYVPYSFGMYMSPQMALK
jgi:protein involved in polysaccharide export with SLBB domain